MVHTDLRTTIHAVTGIESALLDPGQHLGVPVAELLLDRDALEAAHQLYRTHGLGTRDDAASMQYLIPGWEFNAKSPALVR